MKEANLEKESTGLREECRSSSRPNTPSWCGTGDAKCIARVTWPEYGAAGEKWSRGLYRRMTRSVGVGSPALGWGGSEEPVEGGAGASCKAASVTIQFGTKKV